MAEDFTEGLYQALFFKHLALRGALDWSRCVGKFLLTNQKHNPYLSSDVISMEFLRLFLRHHFKVKPVALHSFTHQLKYLIIDFLSPSCLTTHKLVASIRFLVSLMFAVLLFFTILSSFSVTSFSLFFSSFLKTILSVAKSPLFLFCQELSYPPKTNHSHHLSLNHSKCQNFSQYTNFFFFS